MFVHNKMSSSNQVTHQCAYKGVKSQVIKDANLIQLSSLCSYKVTSIKSATIVHAYFIQVSLNLEAKCKC